MKRLFSAILIMILVSVVEVVGVSRVVAQPIPKNPVSIEIETLQKVRLILENITIINNTLNNLADAMPLWSQTLPPSTRFELVLDGAAVLDRETGLVWEQSPSAFTSIWGNASYHCITLEKGGRRGWRLPGIQELTSLFDPLVNSPALPSGHPFSNVRSSYYWSATSTEGYDPSIVAWAFDFGYGNLGAFNKGGDCSAWCVRGGSSLAVQ